MSDHQFRVYSVSETDREALRHKRESETTTNERLISLAVGQKLGGIVEQLQALGMSADTVKRPIRLPISDETLAMLKEASDKTGLPQSTLLLLSLRNYCGATEQPGKGREATGKATKTSRRRSTGRSAKTQGKAKESPGKAAPQRRARKSVKKGAKR